MSTFFSKPFITVTCDDDGEVKGAPHTWPKCIDRERMSSVPFEARNILFLLIAAYKEANYAGNLERVCFLNIKPFKHHLMKCTTSS